MTGSYKLRDLDHPLVGMLYSAVVLRALGSPHVCFRPRYPRPLTHPAPVPARPQFRPRPDPPVYLFVIMEDGPVNRGHGRKGGERGVEVRRRVRLAAGECGQHVCHFLSPPCWRYCDILMIFDLSSGTRLSGTLQLD